MMRCCDRVTRLDWDHLRHVATKAMGPLLVQRTLLPWQNERGLYRTHPYLFSHAAWTEYANAETRQLGIPFALLSHICENILDDVTKTLAHVDPPPDEPEQIKMEHISEAVMHNFGQILKMGELFPGIMAKIQKISFTSPEANGEYARERDEQCHPDQSTRTDVVERYTREAQAYQGLGTININMTSPFIASYPARFRACRLASVIIHENIHIWCTPQRNILLAEGIALYGETSHLGKIYGTHDFRYGVYALAERLLRPLVDRGMYTPTNQQHDYDPLEVLRSLFLSLVGTAPAASPFAILDIVKAMEWRSRYIPGNAGAYSAGWLLILAIRNALLIHFRIDEDVDNLQEMLTHFHDVLRTKSYGSIVLLLESLDLKFGSEMCASITKSGLPLNDTSIIRTFLEAYNDDGIHRVFPPLSIHFNLKPNTPFQCLLYPVVPRQTPKNRMGRN
jgi:hypothetical protein